MGIHCVVKLQIRHVAHAALGFKPLRMERVLTQKQHTVENNMVDVQENSLHLTLSSSFYLFFYFRREHPSFSFMF